VGEIRIEGTWRTTAPQRDVFDVLADLGTWPRWWPAIRAVDLLDGDGPGSAARLTFDTPAPLRPLLVEVEVTTEAPHLLTLAPRRGPVAGSGRIAVTDTQRGSDTDYELRLSFRSLLLKPVETLLAGAARGAGRERLRRAGDDLAAMAGGEPLDHEP
jgi:hypothetical protein